MIVKLESESVDAQVQQCQRLAFVLGLTKEMLQYAQAGEWDRVTAVEQQRREDLVACFADARPSGEPEVVAQALATLLHMNEQLMSMLREARSEVMAQGEALARNRAAHQSYQSVDANL